MDRRTFIRHTAFATGVAAIPGSVFSQAAPTVFRWVPASDLSILDPAYTTAAITASHALLVFDTLFGLDAQYRPQPQMVERETIEQDGLLCTLQLREGLKFHDGSPVRAQDAVASIKRFGARNFAERKRSASVCCGRHWPRRGYCQLPFNGRKRRATWHQICVRD